MTVRKISPVRSVFACLSAFVLSATLAAVAASPASAALVIENEFTGTGSLKITLEQEGIKDVVDCTGSTLKGTVSSPADAKAKLSSWTMTGCTASSGGESFGSATVTVLYSLPAVEALSTNSVKVGSLTVRAEYKVNGSTCKPEVIMGSWNYSYTNGSSTNQLSAKVPHIFTIPPFAPPECLDNGIGYFEPSFSFTNPQFEVTELPMYRLRDSNSAGSPNYSFSLTSQQLGDRPISGDWNGDGIDTVGFYRPSNGSFYLRNSNSSGPADISFPFAETEDRPVAGDWNEDGIDTIGIYRPSNGSFYLSNSNKAGCCSYQFPYGNTEDLPVAGDWNSSGTDTIGLYRPSNGVFYLSNVNAQSTPDYSFAYGNTGNDDLPVAGDWDGNGYFSVGVFRQSTNEWFLDNEVPGTQPISYVFSFGTLSHTTPIAGDWNNSGTDTPGAVWK